MAPDRKQRIRNSRSRAFLMALLVAGGVYWHYTARLRPAMQDAQEHTELVRLTMERRDSLVREVASLEPELEALDGKLGVLETDRNRHTALLEGMAPRMIPQAGVVTLEDSVVRMAARESVEILELGKEIRSTPVPGTESPYFRTLRYTIRATGSFPSVLRYLALLENTGWFVGLQSVTVREPRDVAVEGAEIQVVLECFLPTPLFPHPVPPGRKPAEGAVPDFPDRFAKRPAPPPPPPTVKEPVDWSGLHVTGILASPAGSMAIVNGDIVSVGAEIAGAVLTEVHPDRVLFTKDGERQEFRIMELAQ